MGIFDKLKKKDKKQAEEKIVEKEEVETKEDLEGFMSFQEYVENTKDDDFVPGWDAIEHAFNELYEGQEPEHFATNIPSRAMFGGKEYLDGYSLYKSNNGYYHIVTYGMSQLYADPKKYGNDYSGWGYELTMKVKANDSSELYWAMNMLGNLARYTYTSGSYFQENEYILGDGSPIKEGSDSAMASLLTSMDTEIKGVDTVHGRLDFIQLIGITFHDAQIINEHKTRDFVKSVVNKVKEDNPNFVVDLNSNKNYL